MNQKQIKKGAKMKVIKFLEKGLETDKLEVKREASGGTAQKIAKQMVSMANNQGGYIIIGIDEDERELYDVENRNEISHNIVQALHKSLEVSPKLKYHSVPFNFNDYELLSLYIDSSEGELHSIFKNGVHTIPFRSQNRIKYLTGKEINQYLTTGYLPNVYSIENRERLKFNRVKNPVDRISAIKTVNKVGSIEMPIPYVPLNGRMLRTQAHFKHTIELEDICYRLNRILDERAIPYSVPGFVCLSQNDTAIISSGGFKELFSYIDNYEQIINTLSENKNSKIDEYKTIDCCHVGKYSIDGCECTVVVYLEPKTHNTNENRYGRISLCFEDTLFNTSKIESVTQKSPLYLDTWRDFSITKTEEVNNHSFGNKPELFTVEPKEFNSEEMFYTVNSDDFPIEFDSKQLYCHSETPWGEKDYADNEYDCLIEPLTAHIKTLEKYDLNQVIPDCGLKGYNACIRLVNTK